LVGSPKVNRETEAPEAGNQERGDDDYPQTAIGARLLLHKPLRLVIITENHLVDWGGDECRHAQEFGSLFS